MYQEITEILELWPNAVNRTPALIERLKKAYRYVSGNETSDCGKCQAKWINEIRKWQYKYSALQVPVNERQYVLKPGNHAFVPNCPAIFNNENTSDAACKYYLSIYPHIRTLFIKIPA